jgi:diguanylate cyclase (GGDEF)-like protein
VRLRSRLAGLLLIVVVGPVAGGVVAARALAVRQSVAVADARLQGAAAFVRSTVNGLNSEARRRLTPALALRAVEATSDARLDALRGQAGLDYLIVSRGATVRGAARTASFRVSFSTLAGSNARVGLVSDAHVQVTGPSSGTVWGGLFRDRTFLAARIRLAAVTIARGTAVAATTPQAPARLSGAGFATLAGGWRGLCVCSGTPPSGVLVVARPAPVGLVPPLRPASVALAVVALFLGLVLAFVLAKMVSSPIQRLADDASASIRDELERLQRQLEWDVEEHLASGEAQGDEISRLREAFRTLRFGLRQTVGELGGSKEELRRTQARLSDQEHLSLSDSLTGAWNRRYLDMAVSDAMQRGRRMGHPFAVLMIDIDHFKGINDRFGHASGDDVLVELCRRIKGSLRANLDVLVRYGGEEFVVLLPETGTDGATVVATKVHQVVRSDPFGAPMNPIPVTISIGVASYPADGRVSPEVIAAADANMYRAKRAGRDRVVSSAEEISNHS